MQTEACAPRLLHGDLQRPPLAPGPGFSAPALCPLVLETTYASFMLTCIRAANPLSKRQLHIFCISSDTCIYWAIHPGIYLIIHVSIFLLTHLPIQDLASEHLPGASQCFIYQGYSTNCDCRPNITVSSVRQKLIYSQKGIGLSRKSAKGENIKIVAGGTSEEGMAWRFKSPCTDLHSSLRTAMETRSCAINGNLIHGDHIWITYLTHRWLTSSVNPSFPQNAPFLEVIDKPRLMSAICLCYMFCFLIGSILAKQIYL